MEAAGWIFVVAGVLVLGVGAVLLGAGLLVRLRLGGIRTRVRTIGAISKLPSQSGHRRELEVTYVDQDGRPYVLRQRWSGATGFRPSVGAPVTVWHLADSPAVAAVDSPHFGILATLRTVRATGLVTAALGTLSVLIGAGLLLIVRWGHLG